MYIITRYLYDLCILFSVNNYLTKSRDSAVIEENNNITECYELDGSKEINV
jgi:hypothetical protein